MEVPLRSQGSTGELLQSRADSCREMVQELEWIDLDDLIAEEKESALQELQAVSYSGE